MCCKLFALKKTNLFKPKSVTQSVSPKTPTPDGPANSPGPPPRFPNVPIRRHLNRKLAQMASGAAARQRVLLGLRKHRKRLQSREPNHRPLQFASRVDRIETGERPAKLTQQFFPSHAVAYHARNARGLRRPLAQFELLRMAWDLSRASCSLSAIVQSRNCTMAPPICTTLKL